MKLSLEHLEKQVRRVNRGAVKGESPKYYRDNTDTACIVTENGVDYIYCDGSNRFLEWLKNLLAFRGKKSRKGAYLSYDLTAEDMWGKMTAYLTQSDNKKVFVGVSRGGGFAMGVIRRYIDYCQLKGIKNNAAMVSFVMPPAGGRMWVGYCKRLDFEHVRVTMKGDIVPKMPKWGKHYSTKHIELDNSEKGKINKHKNVGKYLKGLYVDVKFNH